MSYTVVSIPETNYTTTSTATGSYTIVAVVDTTYTEG